MKLSIITINLNNFNGLQRTINSVVYQTFKSFEWIIIDGGSTDGSKELIEQYADHFAYWVSEPDKGIYNAMNKGIKVAKGEYLQFLNSGDWLCDSTTLEECFSHVFTADIVYGDMFFCHEQDKERYFYPHQLSLHFLFNQSLGHPSTFIRRELIQKELYDESLKMVSDWKFFFTQAIMNRKFEHIDEVISCFDTSGLSSTNEKVIEHEREKVIKGALNPMITMDYLTMNEMKNLLNQSQVRKVIAYGKKRKINHKIITASLRLIELLNHTPWRKEKYQS